MELLREFEFEKLVVLAQKLVHLKERLAGIQQAVPERPLPIVNLKGLGPRPQEHQ